MQHRFRVSWGIIREGRVRSCNQSSGDKFRHAPERSTDGVTPDGKALRLMAGDPIVEVVNTLHYGINEGKVPAEIVVFYAGALDQPKPWSNRNRRNRPDHAIGHDGNGPQLTAGAQSGEKTLCAAVGLHADNSNVPDSLGTIYPLS